MLGLLWFALLVVITLSDDIFNGNGVLITLSNDILNRSGIVITLLLEDIDVS